MDEETLRKMAIEQHLQGRSPISIYLEMGRSKYWFFKWLHRYQSGDTEWFKDKPKTPHHHPRTSPLEMQNLVKSIRMQLEDSYAQVGTSAIKWEFKKLGVIPPSDRTINRILKRAGLVKKNSLYPPRGWNIPTSPNPWDSTTSTRQISWVQDTSKTMAASFHSTSWIYTVIASLSTLNEGKTTKPWPWG